MFRKMSVLVAIALTGLHCAFAQSNNWRRPNDTYQEATGNDRTQRLGLTTGYGGVNGYGYSSSGVGGYAPLKIDLGGVVLGTLVGIGALLILPKLVNVFGGGYGGHYRSADSDLTGVTDMLNKVDDFLAQNNIDSGSCMQKAICSYVRSSDYHVQVGTADQIEHMILALSENSLVDYMIDGTAVKDAIKNGKQQSTRSCDELYKTCPLDRQSALQVFKKMFPLGSQ
ncbi:uncharacterized protein LOC129763404 [Toxorhynchites rutilus septentrionalis]|uniref:uncharacterized protein LOC129763404 n=1 Tax=Toxorhynchites rutilus septentrionalis TaxID=329112 RepID=UPI002479256D|nr:uncharacterized protein LOC129763404 [Toxorhynchites rutilus septentrionalis]